MSVANQDNSRSPNPKLARYLHRIQQLMGPRSRSTSPISSRISKSIRPNSLDHYLKYQLTFKIICSFFDKRNKVLMRNFFNNLRVIEKAKIQKIYKFVSIEKTTCAHMTVDLGISAKMLFNLLKLKLKSNLNIGLIALKDNSKNNSLIDTIKSARSHQPKLFESPFKKTQIKEMLGVILSKIYYKRLNLIWNILKLNKYRKQEALSNVDKQKQLRQQIYIKILQASILFNVVQKIKIRNFQNSLNNIKNYIIKSKQKQKKQSAYIIIYQQKLKSLTNQMVSNYKSRFLLKLTELKFFFQSKKVEAQEKTKNQQSRKATYMYIINIFNATNSINKIFDNKRIQNNIQFMKKITFKNKLQCQCLKKIYQIINRNIVIKLSSTFTNIKCFKTEINLKIPQGLQKKENHTIIKQKYNWKAIQALVNIHKFFIHYKKQPFQYIKNARGKTNLQISFRITQTVQQSSEFRSFDNESQFHPKNKSFVKQKQILPKIFVKNFLLQLAEAFVKLKYIENKNGDDYAKDIRKTDWNKDAQTFLQERNRFTNLFINKFNKIEQLIKENKNGNFVTPTVHESKIPFSPKNQNKKTVNFIQ